MKPVPLPLSNQHLVRNCALIPLISLSFLFGSVSSATEYWEAPGWTEKDPFIRSLSAPRMVVPGDEAHKRNREEVKRLYRMLSDTKYVYEWSYIAKLIAINDDPDIASARLINFIENYEAPQNVSSYDQGIIVSVRRQTIRYLGWTKCKRAEDFLLTAYEKARAQSEVGEIHEELREMEGTLDFVGSRINRLALDKVIFALLEFNPEKYTPMIEADYREAARKSGFNPPRSRIAYSLSRYYDRHHSFIVELIRRDLRNEYGAKAFAEMSRSGGDGLTEAGSLLSERANYIHENPNADGWWRER